METDSKTILTHAFQSLELFSVPGLGTFRRSYFPAHIDRATQVISPPGERFILEKGEGYTDRLEAFITKTFAVGDKAKDKIQELRSWVIKELKQGKPLEIAGIGKLQLNPNKEVDFTAEAGQDASGSFFGLQPVAFSIGQPKAETPAKQEEEPAKEESTSDKKKVAAAAAAVTAVAATAVATASNTAGRAQATVENPPLIETVNPPKRKSRAWIWLILVLLLVGAGTAGVIWREDVRDQLVSWGWMSPEGGENNGGDSEENSLAAGDDTDGENTNPQEGTDADGDSSSDENDGDSDTSNEFVEEVETPDNENDLETAPTETVGSFAQEGIYYLVVASGKDATSIKQMRRELGGKIIRPPYEGNYYRLAAFQSSSKDEVIAKMVSNKDKFPKSWIFWKGM